MDIICGVDGQGGAPTPADSLFWSENFPPTVVVFHPVRRPSHWGGFFSVEDYIWHSFFLDLFCGATVKIPVRGVAPTSQSGGSCSPQPHYIHIAELDCLLCFHRMSGCISPRQYRVSFRRPRFSPEGGMLRYPAPQRA